MNLIVGLGNPGKEYESTRHNIGFRLIDKIADYYNFPQPVNKFSSIRYTGLIENNKVMLSKPLTYMNNSGIAVSNIMKYYKIEILKIIIVHDELDLATSRIKIKSGGGNNGHNGLKSITSHIGNEYRRVRIGIDHPRDDVSNYVLSKFSNHEKLLLESKLDHMVEFLPLLIKNDQDFLNKINI